MENRVNPDPTQPPEYNAGDLTDGGAGSVSRGTPDRSRSSMREDAQSAKAAAKDLGTEVVDRAKQAGREQVERAKRTAREQAESGKNAAADQASDAAEAVDQAAGQLASQGHETLAAYASDLASGMERIAGRLRNSSIDDLLAESRDLARRNPTLFILGSIAVGAAITRFLKATPVARQDEMPRADGYAPGYPTYSEDYPEGTAMERRTGEQTTGGQTP